MSVSRWLNNPLISDGIKQFQMNPLRLGLSILGMVFGVASLIAMNAIGEGAQQQIAAIIEAMGIDVVHVRQEEISKDRIQEAVKFSAGISLNDIRAIEQLYPANKLVYRNSAPIADLRTTTRVDVDGVKVFGVSPGFLDVHDLSVEVGRNFLSFDHETSQRVVLIGSDLAQLLEPSGSFSFLLGTAIKVERAYFTVIGVLPPFIEQSGDLLSQSSYNKAVIVPYSTMISEIFPPPPYHSLDLISLKVESLEDTLGTKQFLQPYLSKLHGGVKDYNIIAPEEVLQQRSEAQSLLNMVFAIIATISLVVGGIGIMNIMIASVTERTKEIGLRRALGATQKDISSMFLNESLFISFVGGVFGIFLGIGISTGLAQIAEMPIGYSCVSILFSFLSSTAVGIVFGIYPARKAAGLDPVEALYHG